EHIVSSCSKIPSAILLVLWVLVFTVYVIGRLFGLAWGFVEEFTGYWLVFITYVPLAYALMNNAHIKTDIITNRLPKKARNILEVCTGYISLVIVCYFLARSIEWLINGMKYDLYSPSRLHILLWPIYSFIPIGLALFALALIIKIIPATIELIKRREVKH
ncbi:unnamed protein product, partial [marine sediment metagenome]